MAFEKDPQNFRPPTAAQKNVLPLENSIWRFQNPNFSPAYGGKSILFVDKLMILNTRNATGVRENCEASKHCTAQKMQFSAFWIHHQNDQFWLVFTAFEHKVSLLEDISSGVHKFY